MAQNIGEINKKQKYVSILLLFLGIVVFSFMVAHHFTKNPDKNKGKFLLACGLFVIEWLFLLWKSSKQKLFKPIRELPSWIYYIVVPIASVCIEETTWNISLSKISLKTILLNSLLVAVFTVGLVLITNRKKEVFIGMPIFSFIYGLVNYYVMTYKGYPPMIDEVLAVGTAFSMLGSYKLFVDEQILLATVMLMAMVLGCIYFPTKHNTCHIASVKRILMIVFAVCGMTLTVLIFVFKTDIDISLCDPTVTFCDNGAYATFLASIRHVEQVQEVPEGYSTETAKNIIGNVYEEVRFEGDVLPNVIVIMNESFSDLSVLGNIDTDEVLKQFNAIDPYVSRGYVYASISGGGTCNSEFEFLTGSSMGNIGRWIFPYGSYDLENCYNLADIFKRLGYYTVAMHPYKAYNWNRVEVYDKMGFETYISSANMENIRTISWSASDEYDYEWIERIYEEKRGPLFLFNVTMQNHGGYEQKLNADIDLVDLGEEYNQYQDVVNYMTLIREADTALANLLEYFSKQEEPTVVCLFGDHQPELNDNFITSIYNPQSVEEQEKRYMTPYLIWANYDMASGMNSHKDMSINYLGVDLLDILGIRTDYSDYLLELQKQIPVVNAIGYRTADGTWNGIEIENDFLRDYKIVQYYEMNE